MKFKKTAIMGLAALMLAGCSPGKREYASYEMYPVRSGSLDEMNYTPTATTFSVWSPTADEVRLMLFDSGHEGAASETYPMKIDKEGTWKVVVEKDLMGKFYTFNVKVNDQWLGDTPGIMAKAVGVNGKRAAIIDFAATNPDGWESDVRPELKSTADIMIYEVHHRDFSIHESSGITNKGKFLAFTEEGTVNPSNLATGIDHLKELGVTHVHLLPSYDFGSIDERHLQDNVYNWGYDPQNYNVPEGSYSTDPYDPSSRIKEFKQMVQALHNAGMRVVLDVVYNHTFNTEDSSFEKTAPGYFYRFHPDGRFADASGCGNETASDREMMRKYMIESVLYWVNEYHLDGFRFDLMGIHDIETMNAIREAVQKVDPTIYIYGEGWAAAAPQVAQEELAMKANIAHMPGIGAFSDEMRDGLRGPYSNDAKGGFLAGVPGNEESIKFGIVGAIQHDGIDYEKVNYSDEAWATQPMQMISYVSCHDDMCLVDRIKSAMPNIKDDELKRLDKLAQTVVFTSQGVPFIYAGEEVMRDKQGVHNSYKSPDSINAIDWNLKTTNKDVFDYYKGLIALRKAHPAFRMGNADLVRKHLEFIPVEESNVIAWQLKDNANGDSWNNIVVVINGQKNTAKVTVPQGRYTIVGNAGKINLNGMGQQNGGEVLVPGQTALIMYK